MKKLKFILIQLICVLSASCKDDVFITQEFGLESQAGMRSYDEAIYIAQSNIELLFPANQQSRSLVRTTSKANVKLKKKI